MKKSTTPSGLQPVPWPDATPASKSQSRKLLWILSGSLAIVLLATVASAQQPSDTSSIIDDDGKSQWVSPTHGKPLDLAYLSPGAQIIVALRPAELLKQAEGTKIRQALGPLGQHAIETVEHVTTLPLSDIDRLLVGCQISSAGEWSITYVAHAAHPISREEMRAKLPDATGKDHDGKKYALANGTAYYLPGPAVPNVLVAAPENAIEDVIDLAGQTPPLRRDIERLVARTDADRQITILFAPNSLFSEGQSLFSGQASRLRDPLFWFLGDELSGAALSLNWDANFFLELTASPTLDTPVEKASRIFAKRVTDIPGRLEAYIATLTPQPYGQQIVARFPAMVRKLAKYTRTSVDAGRIVLRCYLPAAAGHNLLLASELAMSESPTKTPTAIVAVSKSDSPASAKERLTKVTSLKFTKDTLESALDQLSQDIGAPIVIRGPDLQADGITKNQSFGIDLSNKPAEEILVEILHLANPDKTSPGTHDARQKLVYIIDQKPDKTDQIVVTTRAKVKERRQNLPAAFQIAKP